MKSSQTKIKVPQKNIEHSNSNIPSANSIASQLTPEIISSLSNEEVQQLTQLLQESGQPIPPALQNRLGGKTESISPQNKINNNKLPNLDKYPAMMNLGEYGRYKKDVEKLDKNRPVKRATTYGYMFSDLLREDIMREMKRTQGSFLVGVNLANLFREFRSGLTKEGDKTEDIVETPIERSERLFKKFGEYIDVDFNEILEKKMGFRDDSEISHLPELHLDRTSTFDQIIDESKSYADIGFKGEITPFGLLMMTRMLDKYKKNTAQWVRVATVLELIYKYLGESQSRQNFFKDKNEISVLSLMDLEEFYNTDHIFMTSNEITEFKKNLDFYKADFLDTVDSKVTTALKVLQKK